MCINVCAVSGGVHELGSRSVIAQWILSWGPDRGRSSAGLWGQHRGSQLQVSHFFWYINSSLHCCCSLAYFSSSVSPKLDGQLSKMITLCIKHATLVNFNFSSLSSVFSSHAPPLPSSQIRWEKNITLGEPPGFLHSWWWYVCIATLSHFFSLDHTYVSYFSTAHSNCRSTLNVWKNVQGWRGKVIAGNAKCIISHMYCSSGIPLIDKWSKLLCYLRWTGFFLNITSL